MFAFRIAVRTLFCFSIACALWSTVLGTGRGSALEVEYIALENTFLVHEAHFQEPIRVELVGGFTLSLQQESAGIEGKIENLRLVPQDEDQFPSFAVTGSGIYREACDIRVNPTATPPNPSFLYLEVTINELRGIRLHAEFPLNPAVFPGIDQLVFRDGRVFHEQDSFMLRLIAEPRQDSFEVFFRRGDVSGDGVRGITDAVVLLMHLFQGLGELLCDDAADANDDGRLDLTDVVSILQHLFQGGGPLPVPSSFCGFDATLDQLGCDEPGVCGRSVLNP